MKFQDDISMPHTHTQTHTRTSRNQYVTHFFKVGDIIKSLDPLRAKKTLIRKQLGHTMVSAIKASSVNL